MFKILYFIKESFRGLYQAKLMTIASILTITVALFFLGIIILTYINIRAVLAQAGGQVEVVAYLADSTAADTAALGRLKGRLGDFPQIKKQTLIDKTAAWKRFETLYGSAMLTAIEANPLPASFEIVLREHYQNPDKARAFVNDLERLPGIESVQYANEWLVLLHRFRGYFFSATILLGIILAVALYVMVSNSIRLTIFARRDLITNMRFAGATDAYIQAPFLLEGVLQGIIGAALGVTAIALLRLLLSHLPFLWGPWFLLPCVIFPVGVIFGWIGSLGAVRKFLR
ncbi:MAG: ABC transporter permease [Chitinivibrionales bacterium]|nr:ABC transporter permease [Chitinivibrionales bacterium]